MSEQDRLGARKKDKRVVIKKQEKNLNREKEKKRIVVDIETEEVETKEVKGDYTTTYEDLFDLGESTTSASQQAKEESSSDIEYNLNQENRVDIQRVKEYIQEIEKTHQKNNGLEEVPPKVPRKWMFKKIHPSQKEAWETAASLRGWLIEHIKKGRGDRICIEFWISTVNHVLIDFFDFNTVKGVQSRTDELYQEIWNLYHQGEDPLDKLGGLY